MQQHVPLRSERYVVRRRAPGYLEEIYEKAIERAWETVASIQTLSRGTDISSGSLPEATSSAARQPVQHGTVGGFVAEPPFFTQKGYA